MADAPTSDPAYEFTNDWFVQNILVWDKLVRRFEPRRFLEIGSYEGRSTCYLIEAFARDHAIEIHCIDSWEGGIEHDKAGMSAVERRFDKNVGVAMEKTGNPATVVKKHKMLSHLALARLLADNSTKQFDLVYVDGSHQAPAVLADAVMAFHLLRNGGLMIFDDYIWTMEVMGQEDLLNMPKLAINSFLNVFQRKMKIVRGAPVYQLYVAKTDD